MSTGETSSQPSGSSPTTKRRASYVPESARSPPKSCGLDSMSTHAFSAPMPAPASTGGRLSSHVAATKGSRSFSTNLKKFLMFERRYSGTA